MQLPPPVHGASVMNQRVAASNELAREFDVYVLPLQFADSISEISRVSVTKLKRAASLSVRLAKLLLTRRPDLVYFTLSPVGGAFYRDCVYVLMLKIAGVPHVFHLHGKGIQSRLDRGWRRALYRWAFSDAWVIHLAHTLAAETRTIVDDEKVLIVANGVPDATDVIREGSEIPRFLYLSNMAEDKGPLVLLEALRLLRDRGVTFRATFAGAPFGDCVARFEAFVREHDLSRVVEYVGPMYGEAKSALFASHDVFVFPTFYPQEAFPLVLLEAMQQRMPVVTTPEGAIGEIVEDAVSGFLVSQRDTSALADRLATLACDPALRVRMGEAGRARYEERFTLSQFETTLVKALRSVGA